MKKVLIFLLIAGVLAAAWFWFKQPSADTAAETKQPAAQVETTLLKTQTIAQTLDAFGVVTAAPSGDQVIVAAFDCLVGKVVVVPGTRVAAGDELLEITPTPDAKLQFDAARSMLVLATKTLVATQERYDLKLANSTELLSAQQAEQDARLKVASFESRGLGTDGKIVAPAAGVVSKLELSSGTLVSAGTILVTVTTEAQLEVRLGVEATDVPQIIVGQSVSLVSANRSDAKPIISKIRVVGGALDVITGAAELRVPVPAGALLMLGEHVRAAIELRKKEALVVPRSAVLPDDGKLVLYTVKNNRAVRHEVATGITTSDLVEVNGSDLHEGDSIVTLGNYELADGMAIQTKGIESKQPDEKGQGPQEAKP